MKSKWQLSLFQKQRNTELEEHRAAASGCTAILEIYMEKGVSSSYENQVDLSEYEKNLDKQKCEYNVLKLKLQKTIRYKRHLEWMKCHWRESSRL